MGVFSSDLFRLGHNYLRKIEKSFKERKGLGLSKGKKREEGGKKIVMKTEIQDLKKVLGKRNRKCSPLKLVTFDDDKSKNDSETSGDDDAGSAFGGKR